MDGPEVASSLPPKPRKLPKIPPLNMQLVQMGLTVADVLQGRKQLVVAAEMNLAAARANRIAAQRVKAQRAAKLAVAEQKASKLVAVQHLDLDKAKRERLQQFRAMNSRRPQSQTSFRVGLESSSRAKPLATGHSNRNLTGQSSRSTSVHTDRHLSHHSHAAKPASTLRPARKAAVQSLRSL